MATTNRRHEQAVLHIKVGDVHKDNKSYSEALEHFQYALGSYEELISEAPIPIHHRGLQTAFSRINALRVEQQRLTAIPATPEVLQQLGEYGGQYLGQAALRTSSLENIHPDDEQ